MVDSRAQEASRTVGEFELTGGDLCLDFVNTVIRRPTPEPEDLLATYADLVRWAEAAGSVSPGEGADLRRRARKEPGMAEGALREARRFRETLFALFHAAATGAPAPPEALDHLNRWLPASLAELRLVGGRGGYVWAWRTSAEALDRPLWPVAWAAAELLTSGRLVRLRVCASERCDWLFLDGSKNGTRRWCDMAVCGNRAKARRHRASAGARRGRKPS